MTRPAIEIQGVGQLAKALKNAGDEGLSAVLKTAHLEGAETVAATARTLAPKLSGSLRSSIRSSATLRSGRVRAGKKKVPYAAPIHFGWGRRGIHPQPFLYMALDRRREEVLDNFMEAIEAMTDDVVNEANK